VDMCKGKRKYDYEAPMTSSLSDCTWLEEEWKFRLSTTWHPSLHFYFFFSLDSSLSYLSCHSSSLFLFSLILIYIYLFISLLFYFSFFFPFFFFLFYTHVFLFIFPLDIFFSLFKALNSSLSCMQTIWNFK
jgi:hypothetical protein